MSTATSMSQMSSSTSCPLFQLQSGKMPNMCEKERATIHTTFDRRRRNRSRHRNDTRRHDVWSLHGQKHTDYSADCGRVSPTFWVRCCSLTLLSIFSRPYTVLWLLLAHILFAFNCSFVHLSVDVWMVLKRYTIVKMSEKMNKKCIATYTTVQLSTICLPEHWSIRLLQLNGMSHGNVPYRLPSLPSPLPAGVGGGSALAQSRTRCARALSQCETHEIYFRPVLFISSLPSNSSKFGRP